MLYKIIYSLAVIFFVTVLSVETAVAGEYTVKYNLGVFEEYSAYSPVSNVPFTSEENQCISLDQNVLKPIALLKLWCEDYLIYAIAENIDRKSDNYRIIYSEDLESEASQFASVFGVNAIRDDNLTVLEENLVIIGSNNAWLDYLNIGIEPETSFYKIIEQDDRVIIVISGVNASDTDLLLNKIAEAYSDKIKNNCVVFYAGCRFYNIVGIVGAIDDTGLLKASYNVLNGDSSMLDLKEMAHLWAEN